ncbi:MAG TPA: SDR family oxidoreductase [Candidatus Saccharimonadales bacterium]|nr:SDR family oxidoreductase [Candidatus Saccharimonadales bacterium]
MPTEKVALITGCSTGFGRVMAETLARHKCRVFAGVRDIKGRNSEKAREVRELAAKESLALSPIELDVTDDTSVDSAIAEVIRAAGQIDVLVNNAGLTVRGLAEAVTVEQMRRIFETNVFAVQRMNRAVLPHMRKRNSGLLIHISSQAGRIVLPGLGTYGASKAALESLVESYHYELAAQGIDAVLVQPGAFATAIGQNADKAADEKVEDAYGPGKEITMTMMGNLGKRRDPQEVADAVLKLVETPAGKRPLRTGVGVNGDFVGELNDFTDKIQVTVVDLFGLKDLTKFKSR